MIRGMQTKLHPFPIFEHVQIISASEYVTKACYSGSVLCPSSLNSIPFYMPVTDFLSTCFPCLADDGTDARTAVSFALEA